MYAAMGFAVARAADLLPAAGAFARAWTPVAVGAWAAAVLFALARRNG